MAAVTRGGLAVAFAISVAVVLAIPSGAGSSSALVRAGRGRTWSQARESQTMVVGDQTLRSCGSSPPTYCGELAVPLDYSQPTSPHIKVAFRWYPAIDPPGGVASGTVLPVEGGPGFPSIESVAGGYRVMYGSLLDDWNLLAIDLRGTGTSTPLDCPSLQNFSGQASGPAFDAVVGSCAKTLDHRWKTSTGTYIHASDLFTSAPAAADVAAVIRALGIGKIDLYGDSYGSFFAQVFASRYPSMIRSVVLDSTYATQDLDPWYRSTIDSMPSDFDDVCSRSPACAQNSSGPSWSDIENLAEELREKPASGVVPGPTGSLEQVTMNVVGLVDLLNDAAGDSFIYRGIDAAARALLEDDDPDPLLRLYAQRLAFDEDYFQIPAQDYSAELYLAVSCLDYPQLFDMNSDQTDRMEQLESAESALPESTFAPFETSEWIAQDQNTEAYTACLDWPEPVNSEPPTTGQPLLPPSVPVLILGGELDTWTPPSGIPQVMSELGGNARFVELANSTHVVGEGDTLCGSQLVQDFVRVPQDVDSINASCAASVPPIDAVGVYPQSLAGEPPLSPAKGNQATTLLLRLGAATISTAGDALARYLDIIGNEDHGLHGGTVLATDGGRILRLSGDILIPGVPVTGTMKVSSTLVSANLSALGPGTGPAEFTVSWPLGLSNGIAQLTGTSGRTVVAGTTYAP
ncbi:MAG TPA: alpha/beta fold hydrolase [Acidimicrobiales bacterium]|nr:alpha/beta fold hydrolase [Acidimicrobiales bacterium]